MFKKTSGINSPFSGLGRTACLTALVVCLLLASTGVVGAQKIELEFWTWLGGVRGEAWAALAERFNEQSDTIQLNVVPRNTNAENLLLAFAGDVPPDLMFSSIVWTRSQARAGLLADLNPYLQRSYGDFTSEFVPGFIEHNSIDGRLYAIPVNMELYWGYAHRGVLAEAGVQEPWSGWTWSDLRDSLRRIVQIDGNGELLRAGMARHSPYGAGITFLAQGGAGFLDESGERPVPALRNPAFSETIYFLDDLVTNRLLEGSIEMFEEGRAGFLMDGSQRTERYTMSVGTEDLIIGPVPVGPPGEPRARASTLTIAMADTGDAERMAAAWEAVEWLTSVESQAFYNAYVNAIPPRLAAISHPTYDDFLRGAPQMQGWIDHVVPHAISDREDMPGEATSAVIAAFNAFFQIEERPPIESWIIQLEHEIDVALDDAFAPR